ncbi:hypothetical protein [Dyadobacter chenhuakuii]|uniref:Uncharacterized protein n=1 Tax=Dyadobacter chenhuakuii TaxID=2909339 RepID=A0ABY5E841_9BACT|nr:hypothetical protein [Dyadobacter chenhuakuii]UTM21804.1 hypothetical protein NFI80_25355 [Dyadobacter chenhuakuii]
MTASYNPFVVLDMPTLKDVMYSGKYFIVVQRFRWPGLPDGQAFIATPYQDQKAAQKHAAKLTAQEGKMLDVRAERDKFAKLFNDPRYVVFVSKFKEGDWQARVIKHYQKNIHSFLTANIGIVSDEKASIELTFEDGHLMAHIISNGEQYQWEACEVIK